MQRILVIGSGGSGKSTFSARLGALLNLPVIHLDALYWRPGWVEPDKAEWAQTIRDVIEQDRWVLDGNYSGTLPERIEACDAIIFLDVARLTCMWRVLKRAIRYRGRTRPDMSAGCPERISLTFLLWIWNYPNRSRRKVMALLDRAQASKKVVRLRTQKDVEVFLRQLCGGETVALAGV